MKSRNKKVSNGFLLRKTAKKNIEELFSKPLTFDETIQNKLENILDVKINNLAIFEQALTHSSFSGMNPEFISNERLEFLGDAVLELIVTDFLFAKYKDKMEGDLTVIRSHLVGKKSLTSAAINLHLRDFLIISYGMQKNNFDEYSDKILSDTMEAIIAAIFIDSGIEAATEFVYKNIVSIFDNEKSIKSSHNYKQQLQEIFQDKKLPTPQYTLLKATGEDHNKEFTMGVFFNDTLLGKGKGKTKKNAEQTAAKNALNKLDLEKIIKKT